MLFLDVGYIANIYRNYCDERLTISKIALFGAVGAYFGLFPSVKIVCKIFDFARFAILQDTTHKLGYCCKRPFQQNRQIFNTILNRKRKTAGWGGGGGGGSYPML